MGGCKETDEHQMMILPEDHGVINVPRIVRLLYFHSLFDKDTFSHVSGSLDDYKFVGGKIFTIDKKGFDVLLKDGQEYVYGSYDNLKREYHFQSID